ncbi:hypothetical protein WJX81_001565 [Elliptochloris bilobata]|uniref:Ubiquitin-like domain-containing protein n=1 Tax=Elliptochloris bilobata TaxID=381761 RepID=A0AAW1RMG0_9CHLO
MSAVCAQFLLFHLFFQCEEFEEHKWGVRCQVCFRLPDGADWVTELPRAQTVEYAVAVLHRRKELPLSAVLIFEGRRLLAPLSLCDSGLEPGQTNLVAVEVQE